MQPRQGKAIYVVFVKEKAVPPKELWVTPERPGPGASGAEASSDPSWPQLLPIAQETLFQREWEAS